jgi:hypothetical protein
MEERRLVEAPTVVISTIDGLLATVVEDAERKNCNHFFILGEPLICSHVADYADNR